MTLSIMTLSIMTLSIMILSIKTLSINTLNIKTLCHYAECYCAECRVFFMLNVIMLSAVLLSVVRPNVGVLGVAGLLMIRHLKGKFLPFTTNIRHRWNWLYVTNALTYYAAETNNRCKKFYGSGWKWKCNRCKKCEDKSAEKQRGKVEVMTGQSEEVIQTSTVLDRASLFLT